MNSPFDLPFLLFIFGPLGLTIALVKLIARRKARFDGQRDVAEGFLRAAVGSMSPERAEWGRAMAAELEHLQGAWERFWFAVGCARVALFPPCKSATPELSPNSLRRFGINCGMLSVALPSLALPFLFVAAFILDALYHGSGDSTSHVVPVGVIGVYLLVGVSMLISGLPLGLAGWYRNERFFWLSALGPCLSVVFASYLWLFLYLFAGGRNGD